jgi:hypothetical protein
MVRKIRLHREHCNPSLQREKTVKTIRRIKIMLTTREILVAASVNENTSAETDISVCPVCHSPLPPPDRRPSNVARQTASGAEPVPIPKVSKTNKLTDGEY